MASGPNKRALLLTYHYVPENVPATMHPRFFARYLPDFGIDVTVLASSFSPHGYDDPGPDQNPIVVRCPLGEARDRMKFQHKIENVLVSYLKMEDWGRPWIPYGADEADRLIAKQPFDYMISFSPCFTSHQTALKVKQRHPDLRWFVYFADPFVGNPFRHVNPVQRRIDKRNERKVFDLADGIVANTPTVETLWRETYPQHAAKITHIPNGFDMEEDVGPQAIPNGRKAPHLVHAGSLYGGRFPVSLLESLERLAARGLITPADVEVHLIGHLDPLSISAPELFERTQKAGFVHVHGRVSRLASIKEVGEADYLLLLDLNSKNTKFQVPSKLFDYLRIGRPILCYTPRGSETEQILAKSGIPHRVIGAESSPEECDRAVLEFLKLPVESSPMSEWARKTFDAREMTGYLAGLLAGKRH
jgi:glycosyltransferase involved in cell wall biosynthesis